jgi:hypothetical protein
MMMLPFLGTTTMSQATVTTSLRLPRLPLLAVVRRPKMAAAVAVMEIVIRGAASSLSSG